jgi:hypothetical protein
MAMADESSLGAERSNALTKRLAQDLIEGVEGNEIDAMIILENLMTGIMRAFRPDPRHAGEFMDAMTMAVIERLKSNG